MLEEVEVFVVIGSDGCYVAASTREAAIERYQEEHESLLDTCDAVKLVRLTAKVELPAMSDFEAEEVSSEDLKK
jgi:hypothetical protein